MKKALLILGLVAFLGAGFTSCKKECKCEAYWGSEHISSYDVSSTTKKKDCKDYTTNLTDYDPETGQQATITATMKCSWGN